MAGPGGDRGLPATTAGHGPCALTRASPSCSNLARGLDNHQIAAHLELSEKTVRNMVSSILAKLEIESRSAAIVRARMAGFGVESSA